MATRELVGTIEAAEILGLTKSGLTAAVMRGDITPAARVGRRGVMVFDVEELSTIRAARTGGTQKGKTDVALD